MLRLLFSSLLACLTCSAFADAALIKQVEQRMLLDESVQGEFQQKKYIEVLPQPLLSSGRFSYDPEQGLVWETLSPIANRLEFNQHGIRQSVDGEVVWQLDAQQPAAVTVTQVITAVLSTDWQRLQEYFALSGEVQEQGWQLQLEPKDEVMEQIVSAISVRGDRVLSSMTLMEANGDRTEISFDVQDNGVTTNRPGE